MDTFMHKKEECILYLVLVIYIFSSKGSENAWALKLLRNREFKLLYLTIIFGLSLVNPKAALLVAVLYVTVSMSVSQTESFSTFTSTPSPGLAIATVANTVTGTPPKVTFVSPNSSVTVITPTVTGGTLTNPNVVIAPVKIVNEAGNEVVVVPNVLVIEPESCYPERAYDMSKVTAA